MSGRVIQFPADRMAPTHLAKALASGYDIQVEAIEGMVRLTFSGQSLVFDVDEFGELLELWSEAHLDALMQFIDQFESEEHEPK